MMKWRDGSCLIVMTIFESSPGYCLRPFSALCTLNFALTTGLCLFWGYVQFPPFAAEPIRGTLNILRRKLCGEGWWIRTMCDSLLLFYSLSTLLYICRSLIYNRAELRNMQIEEC